MRKFRIFIYFVSLLSLLMFISFSCSVDDETNAELQNDEIIIEDLQADLMAGANTLPQPNLSLFILDNYNDAAGNNNVLEWNGASWNDYPGRGKRIASVYDSYAGK